MPLIFFLWYNNLGVNNNLFLFLFQSNDSHRPIDKGGSSRVAQAGAACALCTGRTGPDAFWYTTGTAGQGWQDLGGRIKGKNKHPQPHHWYESKQQTPVGFATQIKHYVTTCWSQGELDTLLFIFNLCCQSWFSNLKTVSTKHLFLYAQLGCLASFLEQILKIP